jgi:hypothetical protein
MSLFKKPKKSIAAQRRVFSSENDFDNGERMDIDEDSKDSCKDDTAKKKDKKDKSKPAKSSLLSFGDEGNDTSLRLDLVIWDS